MRQEGFADQRQWKAFQRLLQQGEHFGCCLPAAQGAERLELFRLGQQPFGCSRFSQRVTKQQVPAPRYDFFYVVPYRCRQFSCVQPVQLFAPCIRLSFLPIWLRCLLWNPNVIARFSPNRWQQAPFHSQFACCSRWIIIRRVCGQSFVVRRVEKMEFHTRRNIEWEYLTIFYHRLFFDSLRPLKVGGSRRLKRRGSMGNKKSEEFVKNSSLGGVLSGIRTHDIQNHNLTL